MKLGIGFAIALSVFLAVGLLLAGCAGKSAEPSAAKDAAAPDTEPVQTAQANCPVMGDPIDPEVFAEHNGKRVYFCCKDCIGKFKANPDKYFSGEAGHEGHGSHSHGA
jgi:YHS domain-containing protein